jgi:hypothetical protein
VGLSEHLHRSRECIDGIFAVALDITETKAEVHDSSRHLCFETIDGGDGVFHDLLGVSYFNLGLIAGIVFRKLLKDLDTISRLPLALRIDIEVFGFDPIC